MARLRLEIPDLSDEDVQRLIAALAGVVPGVDLKIEVETDMAKAAVKTKARRATVTQQEPERAKMGRKPKGRTPITVHLEPGALVALESTAKRIGKSRSDTMNAILNLALTTGLLSSVT